MTKAIRTILLLLICFQGFTQNNGIVVPNGHAASIEGIKISPDRKYIYTADYQRIIMWDMKTYNQLLRFDLSSKGEVATFELSPDGNYVMSSNSLGLRCFSTRTGKMILDLEGNYYSANFSADSKTLYYIGDISNPKTHKLDYGIIAYDLQKRVEKPHFICEDFGNCNFKEFKNLKAGVALLHHVKGWQILDLDAKKIIFTSNYEARYKDQYGNNYELYFSPIPGTDLLYSKQKNKIVLYDALKGTMLGKIDNYNDEVKVIADFSQKQFLFDLVNNLQTVSIFEVDKPTLPKNTISKKQLDKNPFIIYNGQLDSKKNLFYWVSGSSVNVIDIISKKIVGEFTGKTAYAYAQKQYSKNNLFYLTTPGNQNNTNILTLDCKRMVITDLKTIKLEDEKFPDTEISPTGDTVLLKYLNEDISNFNLKTKVNIKFNAIKADTKPYDNERPSILMGSKGEYQFLIKKIEGLDITKQTLSKINIKTQTLTRLFDFHHFIHFDAEKDLFISTHVTGKDFEVKVWDLLKNTPIYTYKIELPKEKTKDDLAFSDYLNKSVVRGFISDERVLFLDTDFGNIKFDLLNNRAVPPTFKSYGGTISPDGQKVAASNNRFGISVRNDSKLIVDNLLIHEGASSSLFYSSDSRLLYSFGGDNTLKIIDTDNGGKLLGTLYLFKDSKDYVFIDPDGRFDGTADGMKKLYYLKDRNIITLDKVFEKFYTPNLYTRLLNGEKFDPIPPIDFRPKPITKIIYAQKQRNLEVEEDNIAYNNTSGVAELTVSATAPDDKVDEIRLFHNGKIVNLATRGMFVTDNDGSDSKKYTVNLLPGINTFRAISLNSERTESDADEIVVNYGQSSSLLKPKPINGVQTLNIEMIDPKATLHLLVVGINQYQNNKMNLNYAIADATAFKNEIEKDAKSVIANFKTYFVTDASANTEGIKNAFKQVQTTAKPNDVFVFYYAGHGVVSTKNKEFYLVPTNVSNLNNVDIELTEKGIAAKILQQFAIDIPAQKQLFILDACQSAGAFDKMLQQTGDQQKSLSVIARSTGTHWLAASGSQQFANEFSQLGHGAFTYVLLNALKGEAASNKMITVYGLRNFLATKVPELLQKYGGSPQYPASYGTGNDFPIEIIKQ